MLPDWYNGEVIETNYVNIFQNERRRKTMMVRTIIVKARQRQTLPFLRESSSWVS